MMHEKEADDIVLKSYDVEIETSLMLIICRGQMLWFIC